jgi:PPOX class probable F420-dependent enzyme
VSLDPRHLPDAMASFLVERHLGTLTTLRPDGTPHVVAVGFTWDPANCLVRVITWGSSRKARNVRERWAGPAAVCQVDGGRWATLEGAATVTAEPGPVTEGVRRYTERYRPPKERADRVVIEIQVSKVMGRA